MPQQDRKKRQSTASAAPDTRQKKIKASNAAAKEARQELKGAFLRAKRYINKEQLKKMDWNEFQKFAARRKIPGKTRKIMLRGFTVVYGEEVPLYPPDDEIKSVWCAESE